MSLYDREGIENYERRAFYEQVEIDKEEIISALKTQVSCWTENEIESGFEPTVDSFTDYHPEWDHAELYPTINAEMERVRLIVESEKRGHLSGLGKAGFIIRGTFGLR